MELFLRSLDDGAERAGHRGGGGRRQDVDLGGRAGGRRASWGSASCPRAPPRQRPASPTRRSATCSAGIEMRWPRCPPASGARSRWPCSWTMPADEAPDQHSVALGLLGVLRRLAREAPAGAGGRRRAVARRPLGAGAALRRPAAARCCRSDVLVAWRTDGGEPVPLELERAAATLERLGLPPLSLGAVQRLLQDRLGFLPPRPALRRLHELSGGNPFFALELGRALRAGTLELQPGERLPVALEALVDARLGALCRPSRATRSRPRPRWRSRRSSWWRP